MTAGLPLVGLGVLVKPSPAHGAAALSRLALMALTGVVLVAGALPADAASALKACKKGCKAALSTCTQAAKREVATSRTACRTATNAKLCRRGVKRLSKVARRVCGSARARCRACCSDGRTGCDVPPELPRFSGEFPMPDRRGLDETPLPPGPNGQGFMLLELPDGTFSFDPAARSPVSGAAECATVVLACFHPTLRNWAGCFASVPECETDTPWVGDHAMCCSAGCGERYQELRASGRSDPEAFGAAIWEAPSCMPALAGHVREPQP
jgi:hypothetical protein